VGLLADAFGYAAIFVFCALCFLVIVRQLSVIGRTA
jgi:hypothetical protein